MKGQNHEMIAKRFDEGKQLDNLIREAVRNAIQTHFSRGEQVVVWRNGQAVWVDKEGLQAKD